jgi:hypothetical protein
MGKIQNCIEKIMIYIGVLVFLFVSDVIIRDALYNDDMYIRKCRW